MALPEGITPKTVTVGIPTKFNGQPATGSVTLSAPVNLVHVPTATPIFSGSVTKQFRGITQVEFTGLCPTDADGLNRVDWTYTLTVRVNGAVEQPEPIDFVLPEAGPDTIDADLLVEVPSSAGTPVSVLVLTADNLDGYTAGYLADPDSETRAALDALELDGAAYYNPTAAELEADPDGALTALSQAILNGGRIDAISLNRVAEDVITLPPGRWVITDPGAFMSGTPSDGRRTRGLTIQGSGRYTTEIVFDPASAGYLFDNQDRVSRITLRDITFTGGSSNASFMNSVSNGGPQDMICERVVWRGTWDYGFNLSGTDVNSEFNFLSCGVLGTWGTFLYNTNVQALNHNFVACNIEPDTGDMLNYTVGGHINIFGGSWIGAKNNTSGTGTLIKLGASTAAAVNRFLMSGVRVEHRSPTYKLIDSQWSSGTITFVDMHDTGYQSDLANQPTYTRAVFSTANSGSGFWPHITFERCRLYGKHQYVTLGQNDAFRQDIVYRDCTIQGHSKFADFIITTLDASVSTRLGAVAPIKFEGCRSASNTSSTLVPDQTLNGHIVKNAMLSRRLVSMRNGFGTLPATGDTALTVTLPLNAVITSVRAFGRAASSAGVNTGWSYVLQTTEGTPTVLFSKGGADSGAGQSTGFNLETTPWFIADSDTKRALTLTAGTNTSGSGTAAYFLIEYFV